jgi:hypothetical protein
MNDRVPLRFRLISAVIHGFFAVPMGWLFTELAFTRDNNDAKYSIEIIIVYTDFLFVMPMIIILPLIIPIAGLTVAKMHPFVDKACIDVGNYSLNNFIVIFFIFVFLMAASRSDTSSLFAISGGTFFIGSLIILHTIAMAYFINSVISGIFALAGYRFKNRLICPLIPD